MPDMMKVAPGAKDAAYWQILLQTQSTPLNDLLLGNPRPLSLEQDLLQDHSKIEYTEISESGSKFLKHVFDPGSAQRPHSTYPQLDALDTLGYMCLASKLERCPLESCIAMREKLATRAPQCKWKCFRDYILTLASCALTINHKHQGSSYLDALISAFRDYLRDTKEWSSPTWRDEEAADMFGVLDLLYRIQPLTGAKYEVEPNLIQALYLRSGKPLKHIIAATSAVASANVCQKRLWDLVQANGRREASLPAIMDLAEELHHGFKDGHEDCTENTCPLTYENSTTVQQRHFCANHDCDSVAFDMQRLNSLPAEESHRTTAWSLFTPDRFILQQGPLHERETYMAVSHVWSDGTGVGLKTPGVVNGCILSFFASLARRLKVDGIWWDAICLPTEREPRRLANSQMHENFRKAEVTVIHDRQLMEMEWKDDGSPCLALVLSTWFTRGWTVLELWASENVKVLFKNPAEPDVPLLKDLEDDILAEDTKILAHPAHRIASDIIRRVRRDFHPGKSHKNNLQSRELLPRLLSILQPRTTSWANDRMIIAGLMARIEGFDASWTQARITKEILTTFPVIHPSMLLHDKVTMTLEGPWSWCPPSLLDFKLFHLSTFSRTIRVHNDGTVWGQWRCQRLTPAVADLLRPYSSHMSVSLRIQEALRMCDRCLLLSPPDRPQPKKNASWPYLLVIEGIIYAQPIWEVAVTGTRCSTLDEWRAASPIDKGPEPIALGDNASSVQPTLDCEYIGTVLGAISDQPALNAYIRLGHDPRIPYTEEELTGRVSVGRHTEQLEEEWHEIRPVDETYHSVGFGVSYHEGRDTYKEKCAGLSSTEKPWLAGL